MTTFYSLAARLSGMAAFVCAVLAVLAHPSVSRADPPTCYDYCSALYDPVTDMTNYMKCMSDCGGAANGVCTGDNCSNGCVGSYKTDCDGGCTQIGKGVCTGCKCKAVVLGENCTCY
jgi:hypothetical protein